MPTHFTTLAKRPKKRKKKVKGTEAKDVKESVKRIFK